MKTNKLAEEKCLIADKKGFKYDVETGNIFNISGNKINPNKEGYVYLTYRIDNKCYTLQGHHYAFYKVYGYVPEIIDHIDRNKSNNKINNLRSVSLNENQWNRNPKGYFLVKNKNLYKSQITINNKQIYLGYYKTEDEAKTAYQDAKKIYHTI